MMLLQPAPPSSCFYGFILPLMVTASLIGCVGTRVEYFTDESYPSRDDTAQVEWLGNPPARPYQELARITVSSTSAGDETLRGSLLKRAGRLGADAVIMDPPLVIQSAGPTPYFEPGLLGPMGAAFQMYGYGWYTPYASNPYILIQGAVDQPRVDRALSAIAIKYEDVSPAAP